MSDPDAFSRLYEEHRGSIVRYLRRRLGDDAAEDAAAEVFSRALDGFSAYRDRHGTPLPWLYGISTHVISERRRAERRRMRTIERLTRLRPTPPPGPDVDATLDPQLARALSQLSLEDRETLLLVAWGELTYNEVAETLGVPVGTVASRLARVRRQLQASAGLNPSESSPATGEAHV